MSTLPNFNKKLFLFYNANSYILVKPDGTTTTISNLGKDSMKPLISQINGSRNDLRFKVPKKYEKGPSRELTIEEIRVIERELDHPLNN